MQAPEIDVIRHALTGITLDDKYRLAHGRVFMNGLQALVRLPMLQQVRDAARAGRALETNVIKIVKISQIMIPVMS